MNEDGLEVQRALTREFREALDAFSEDARRLVQEEVSRGSPAPEEWAELARRVAAEEIRASARRNTVAWPTALAGAGLALGVAAMVLVVGRAVGGSGVAADDPLVQTAVAAPAPADSVGGDSDASHPAWVRFDSLTQARDSAFLALIEAAPTLDSAAAALVSEWWSGAEPPSDATLDVLVRLAMRHLGDSAAVNGPVSADLMARLIVLRAVDSP